jgi:hypothetical protein
MAPMRLRLFLACFAALGLAACVSKPPPIARGLSPNIHDAQSEFAELVPTRFPVGSAASDLVAELHREHFKIGPANFRHPTFQFTAVVNHPGLGCRTAWDISWTAEADRITAIESSYMQECL